MACSDYFLSFFLFVEADSFFFEGRGLPRIFLLAVYKDVDQLSVMQGSRIVGILDDQIPESVEPNDSVLVAADKSPFAFHSCG